MLKRNRLVMDLTARPATRDNAGGSRYRAACRALVLAISVISAVTPWTVARADKPIGTTTRQERLRDALRRHALQGLNGESLTVGKLQGEVVVVNFWASWCRPCRRELPALDTLHRDLVKKGGRVVAISIDLDRKNVQRFVKTNSIQLPVYYDSSQYLARWIDLSHIPYTVVLDRSGNIVYTTPDTGGELDELTSVTRKLLGAKGLAASAEEGTR
jgi:thiol-disulfide isomerase/thioredoxin